MENEKLILQISEDVAVIKTELKNYNQQQKDIKDAQKELKDDVKDKHEKFDERLKKLEQFAYKAVGAIGTGLIALEIAFNVFG